MSATRTSASGATAFHVINLRPRVLARRASAQRELLVARRRRVAPGHQRPLEIVAEVLERTPDVPVQDLDAWERLLDLVEQRDGVHAIPSCSATANLFGLAVFGDTLDHEALADLAALYGHQRLARLQHRHASPLEHHPALPLTTRAVRRLVAPGLAARLEIDLMTCDRVEEIDDASLRAAHALLVQGVDRSWTVPVLDSVAELRDIATHGTVVEWRHHMAMVLSAPWSAYTDRIAELAQEAGDAHAASVVATFIDLSREHAAGAGLDPLRREIGGLATAGRSLGTPAGVVATYLGGTTRRRG